MLALQISPASLSETFIFLSILTPLANCVLWNLEFNIQVTSGFDANVSQ